MKRILITIFCLIAFYGCGSIQVLSGGDGKFSIMQSSTNEDSTILNILWHKDWDHVVEVFDESQKSIPFDKKELKLGKSPWSMLELSLTKLNLKNKYRLVVKESSGKKSVLDERWFKTTDLSRKEVRLLLASCLSDQYPKIQKDMWNQASAHKADAFLLVGDNTYGDYLKGVWLKKGATPAQLWNSFVDARKMFQIYKLRDLVPVYATWDDHDFGMNNGNKSFKHAYRNAQVMRSFFPNGKMKHESKGPGVSYKTSHKHFQFFFLDNRSFRDSVKNSMGTHFGLEQSTWLKKGLNKNKKFSFIISGDQFFGSSHPFESYERHHPNSFDAFMNFLKGHRLVLLSGDRHLSEIQNIDKSYLGYPGYEITSSAIHAKVFPGSFKSHPNPNQLAGVDGKYNFIILDFKKMPKEYQLRARAEVHGGEIAFDQSMVIPL